MVQDTVGVASLVLNSITTGVVLVKPVGSIDHLRIFVNLRGNLALYFYEDGVEDIIDHFKQLEILRFIVVNIMDKLVDLFVEPVIMRYESYTVNIKGC